MLRSLALLDRDARILPLLIFQSLLLVSANARAGRDHRHFVGFVDT
jgi:hypothetical protein